MSKKWPTREHDLRIANIIMEEYADDSVGSLGLFEVVVDEQAKRMNFRVATWVQVLTDQFTSMYGDNHGDYVTRQVLSDCIVHGKTLH